MPIGLHAPTLNETLIGRNILLHNYILLEIHIMMCPFQSQTEKFSKEISIKYSGAYLWNKLPL